MTYFYDRHIYSHTFILDIKKTKIFLKRLKIKPTFSKEAKDSMLKNINLHGLWLPMQNIHLRQLWYTNTALETNTRLSAYQLLDHEFYSTYKCDEKGFDWVSFFGSCLLLRRWSLVRMVSWHRDMHNVITYCCWSFLHSCN